MATLDDGFTRRQVREFERTWRDYRRWQAAHSVTPDPDPYPELTDDEYARLPLYRPDAGTWRARLWRYEGALLAALLVSVLTVYAVAAWPLVTWLWALLREVD